MEDLLELIVRLFLEPQNAEGFNLSTLKSKIKKSFGKKLSETAFGVTKMIDLFQKNETLSSAVEVAQVPDDPKKVGSNNESAMYRLFTLISRMTAGCRSPAQV